MISGRVKIVLCDVRKRNCNSEVNDSSTCCENRKAGASAESIAGSTNRELQKTDHK